MDENDPDDSPDESIERPRFLLPDGCKDLIDALRLKEREATGPSHGWTAYPPFPVPGIILPEPVTVRELAVLLKLKPFQIIGTLMQMNIFVSPATELDIATAEAVCATHGATAMKAI